jgi:hypothetical protein
MAEREQVIADIRQHFIATQDADFDALQVSQPSTKSPRTPTTPSSSSSSSGNNQLIS